MSASINGRLAWPASSAWAGRRVTVVAVGVVYAVAASVYGWQAWSQGTPWIFPDETLHARVAQAIAGAGSAPIAPLAGLLYSVLIAPAWLLHDPVASYDLAKLIGVCVMCAVVVPAYLLARLFVRPPLAVIAAAGAVAIPGMFYSSLLMQESLAYPYATLVLYLLTSGLLSESRARLGLAFALGLVGPLIRPQLVVLPLIVVLATFLYVWFGDWARRRRANWTLSTWLAAAGVFVLALAAAAAFGAAVSVGWRVAVQHPGRLLRYAVLGFGPFAAGVGILPVLITPAVLFPAARRGRDAVSRAFAPVFVAGLIGFVLYTAAKEAFLASKPDVYTTLDLLGERNLIYLSPLVFTGTALWLASRKVNLAVLLGSTGIVLAIFAWMPYVFAAPSAPHSPTVVSISHLARELGLSHTAVRAGLLAATAAAALTIGASTLTRSRVTRALLLSTAAVTVVGWSVTGEVNASNTSRNIGRVLVDSQPRPLDWIDRATAGRPAAYVGQAKLRPPEILSLAFWNQSLGRLVTLEGAPVFGLIDETRVASLRGRLTVPARASYVVADREVEVEGERITRAKRWSLYRVDGPVRLRSFQAGVWQDGWMESTSSYDRFEPRDGRPGHMHVFLSQKAGCGPNGARARIAVGPLASGSEGLSLARPTSVREVPILACRSVSVALATPPAPFGVRVRIAPTFVPAQIDPASTDTRHLGAQIAFRFESLPSGS